MESKLISSESVAIKEEWKQMKAPFDQYLISNLGNVKNIKTGKLRNISVNKRSGMYEIKLTNKEIYKHYMIHRLVAEYFVENANEAENVIVDFIDGDHLNVVYTNLRWINASQQTQKSKKRSNTVSKYRGLVWNDDSKKWMVSCYPEKGKKLLMYIQNEIEAAKMYNELAKQYYGEFANLNKFE